MADRHKSCGICRTTDFPGHSSLRESSSRTVDRTGDYCSPRTSRRSSDFDRRNDLVHSGHAPLDKGRSCCPMHHPCHLHRNRCSRSCNPSVCSNFPYCSCHHCTSRRYRDHTYCNTAHNDPLDSTATGMAVARSRFLRTHPTLKSWPAGFLMQTSPDCGPTFEPLRLPPELPRPSASCTAELCS